MGTHTNNRSVLTVLIGTLEQYPQTTVGFQAGSQGFGNGHLGRLPGGRYLVW